MAERTPQSQDKFIVRLPDGMRDRIKAAAERNNRSMNAEIVATLEDKYPDPRSSFYSAHEIMEYIEYLRDEAGADDVKLAEVDALERATAHMLEIIGLTHGMERDAAKNRPDSATDAPPSSPPPAAPPSRKRRT